MRYIRVSGFPQGGPGGVVGAPMIAVVGEDALAVPLDSYVEHMHASLAGSVFIASDIFEHDGDLASAALVAQERWKGKEQDEINQAISYHWNGEALRVAREMVANPDPAPLSPSQIVTVLEQLARHPNYDGQLVICNTVHGGEHRTVEMKNGEVKVYGREGGE